MKEFPKLKSQALLAPMSNVSDIAFRELCRSYGAGLTYTEFVNSCAVIRGNKKTEKKITLAENEKPSAIQIFGNNKIDLLKSAKIVEKKFDIIDINCGCPAYKVIKIGAGSELLNNPNYIGEIVKLISSKIKKPLSVKIRSGIDECSINAIEVAKIIEKNGGSAITLHSRTQKQGYSGRAEWNLIKKVKESVKIPVIGNGDITTPEEFKKMLEFSGVDYIMIGRGAIGNPYLFRQINDYLKKGTYDKKSKELQFKEYLSLAIRYNTDFNQIRFHAISFTKGLVGGANIRKRISEVKNTEDIKKLFEKITF
jgi:tRNA-dihydrouridine synthase B